MPSARELRREARWSASGDPRELYAILAGEGLPDRVWWLVYFNYDPLDLSFSSPEEEQEHGPEDRLILAKCEAGFRFVDGLIDWREVLAARFPGKDCSRYERVDGAKNHARRELDVDFSPWRPGCAGAICRMVRCVVGDPFSAPRLATRKAEVPAWDGGPAGWREECAWLTPDVAALLKAARDPGAGRFTLDPDLLLALADALERAGCRGEACPCRGPGKKCHRCHAPVREEREHHSGEDYDGTWVCDRSERCPRCQGAGLLACPILDHLRDGGPHYRGCWVIDTLLARRTEGSR